MRLKDDDSDSGLDMWHTVVTFFFFLDCMQLQNIWSPSTSIKWYCVDKK